MSDDNAGGDDDKRVRDFLDLALMSVQANRALHAAVMSNSAAEAAEALAAGADPDFTAGEVRSAGRWRRPGRVTPRR
jgi:hypothetical protein